MSSMSKFYTRNKANLGIKVLLTLPDDTPTDRWLLVQGQDSDDYQKAYAELQKLAVETGAASDADKPAKQLQLDGARKNLVANCVKDWNLEDPCTFENVCTLLTEAPQIKTQVEGAVYNRKRFFAENSAG